jgi:hypothetical protein
VKKKNLNGQGGCSSAKRVQRAHPQLVHWWLLIHSSPRWLAFCMLSERTGEMETSHKSHELPPLIKNQIEKLQSHHHDKQGSLSRPPPQNQLSSQVKEVNKIA